MKLESKNVGSVVLNQICINAAAVEFCLGVYSPFLSVPFLWGTMRFNILLPTPSGRELKELSLDMAVVLDRTFVEGLAAFWTELL